MNGKLKYVLIGALIVISGTFSAVIVLGVGGWIVSIVRELPHHNVTPKDARDVMNIGLGILIGAFLYRDNSPRSEINELRREVSRHLRELINAVDDAGSCIRKAMQ